MDRVRHQDWASKNAEAVTSCEYELKRVLEVRCLRRQRGLRATIPN
jgi:hypothetical protein